MIPQNYQKKFSKMFQWYLKLIGVRFFSVVIISYFYMKHKIKYSTWLVAMIKLTPIMGECKNGDIVKPSIVTAHKTNHTQLLVLS